MYTATSFWLQAYDTVQQEYQQDCIANIVVQASQWTKLGVREDVMNFGGKIGCTMDNVSLRHN